MRLTGSFTDRHGAVVVVTITVGGIATPCREIGTEASGVWFTNDPVEVRTETNDTMDHLLRRSAKVRLLTREWLGGLFAEGVGDVTVVISRDGECLFAGYVEPQAYSQGYNESLDEVELNCIDALTAMQYSRYGGIGALGVIYDAVKAGAREVTAAGLVLSAIEAATKPLTEAGSGTAGCLYDGSRAMDSTGRGVFDGMAVSELLFLGDTEDDVWSQDEVVDELLKYLNLHIVQLGMRFYIFSWESIKSSKPIAWSLIGEGATASRMERRRVTISTGIVSDCDTQVSVSEVYNRLSLTCEIKGVENVIENPLDSGSLTSPYDNRQLYMTEYSSEGDGETALRAMWDILHDTMTTYGKAFVRDWYIRVKEHPRWRFRYLDDYGLRDKMSSGRHQESVPFAQEDGTESYHGAWLMAFGSSERPRSGDNSPAPAPDMSDTMILTVGGLGFSSDHYLLPYEDDLTRWAPYAEYTGAVSGGAWSPADSDSSNYIVISGSILAVPITSRVGSMSYAKAMSYDSGAWWRDVGKDKVVYRGDGYGYYVTAYYEADTPLSSPVVCDRYPWIAPWSDGMRKLYKIDRLTNDTVSKVSVLRCMLVVGDKCVKEDAAGGDVSSYKWVDYKTREQCADDAEYYAQSFGIGFDPAQGTYILGDSLAIQNNVLRDFGIEAKGTAIRIRQSDRLHGPVTFRIVAPMDFRISDLSTEGAERYADRYLVAEGRRFLPRVAYLMLKDFEIKLYSDNGGVDNLLDNDVVYVSDTREGFVNERDDVTFRINSGLTTDERREMGVSDSVKLSVPVDTATGLPVMSIYDKASGEQVKPEQLYIDRYWREYHRPRLLMEQTLEDTGGNADPWATYTHPAMQGKDFMVLGITRDLSDGTARMTLKEIDND
ncbi:MAG: hypothetical protein NC117_02725 [Pseudoflavonifractor sp.]|nr:hypothetical protein [Pseudoflavonifractor sp.]